MLILIGLDIITKWLAVLYLEKPMAILPGILQLSLSFNPGVAFSIPVPHEIMLAITPFLLVIIVLLIARYFDFKKNITKIILSLVIAGGLGNFINRVWTDGVIDFIDFSFWPSFNLADAYLTIGVFLLIIFYGKIKI